MIIDQQVRALVHDAESLPQGARQDTALHSLINRLHENCAQISAQRRYRGYGLYPVISVEDYPMDKSGYAHAFDPLEDEEAFWECWQRHGIVVGRKVVSKDTRRYAVQRLGEIATSISDGAFSLDKPESYGAAPCDASGTPILSRGFFDVYHDDGLAQLRQSLRVYIHHVVLWGRADLWTSFDRYGVKLPCTDNAAPLPLHVDQNPLVRQDFASVQGILALKDCPLERGTFVGVPGSKMVFPNYIPAAQDFRTDYRGDYVELRHKDSFARRLIDRAQALPLRAGDMISWDSRTTHANSANLSDKPRLVAHISAGPAHLGDENAVAARADAFATGVGSNNRAALMHASRKPRYSDADALQSARRPEVLTKLGRRLYGLEKYD